MEKDITPERWQRIDHVLDEALELTATQRESFLEESCAGDPELREEVERLLEADGRAHRFLEVPPRRRGTASASEADADAAAESAKRFDGKYRILRKIGDGGMGEVFEAEQLSPVLRRVALKLIKSGMDTKQVVGRFESERQALALMNHTNIARIFDAGSTAQGQPYFAMEYVKGVPITKHCDTYRSNTRERLELFCQVCDGVQHAHENGIIHRDIKPSNILVMIQDTRAIPKIIDFGVAKATGRPLTDDPSVTQMGQFIGTPAYVSPEQAEMTGQDIDTRTDVYSLGVLLYELLLGMLPFERRVVTAQDLPEFRREIRENQPPKPSSRLTTLSEDASAAAALMRKTSPASLVRQLTGNLDRIAMMALESDRTRRYGSAANLAADIRRHLAGQQAMAGVSGEAASTEMGMDLAGAGDELPLAWIAVVRSRVESERRRTFQIASRRTFIGRSVMQSDLVIKDSGVGRRHAAIRFERGVDSDRSEFVLYDLASTNGTTLNGEPLSTPRNLRDGDRVVVGQTELVFKRV